MSFILEKDDVFSWANAEEAKEYIGKKCYLGDSLDDLQKKIKDKESSVLKKIFTWSSVHVDIVFAGPSQVFGLCLPVEKVKKEAPTYTPCETLRDLVGFLNKNDNNESLGNANRKNLMAISDLLGYKMHIRSLGTYTGTESLVVITEVNLDDNCVYMGGHGLLVSDLVSAHEFWNGEQWLGFSILRT